MMRQPASHHTGLPARPRSPAKSLLIMDGMTDGSLGSHAPCTLHPAHGNMHDPAVQSQRSPGCWEVAWRGPHECGR